MLMTEEQRRGRNTETGEKQTMAIGYDYSTLIMLRGPLLITATLATIAIPYLEQISVETLARTVLLTAAFCLFLYDTKRLLSHRLRRSLQEQLNKIVLDDILKFIFDPEVGLIATVVGTFVGNATIYSLPTSPEQRSRLVASALEGIVEPTQAQSVLREPGGLKALLPKSTQTWLNQEDEHQKTVTFKEDCETASEDGHSLASSELSTKKDDHMEMEEENCGMKTRVEDALNSERDSMVLPKSPPRELHGENDFQSSTPDGLPHNVLGTIIQEVTRNKFDDLLQSLPSGSLETVSAVSAIVLLTQLRWSGRARQILWTVLQGSMTLGSTTALFGALAAAVIKNKRRDDTSSSSPSRTRDASSSLSIVKSAWSTIASLLRNVEPRRWQGIIAALVLLYFGRKRGLPQVQ